MGLVGVEGALLRCNICMMFTLEMQADGVVQ